MKINEIYDKYGEYSKEILSSTNAFPDKTLLNKCTQMERPKIKARIDGYFGNTYKTYPVTKKGIGVLVGILVASLLIPITFKFRILIGLVGCIVFEFIVTGGAKFLIHDVSLKTLNKDEYRSFVKLKTGKFVPVIIGTNCDDGKVEVHDIRDDHCNVENAISQFADKETLPVLVNKYMSGERKGIEDISKDIRSDIFSRYTAREVLMKEHINKIDVF